jgi:hypothetical protein
MLNRPLRRPVFDAAFALLSVAYWEEQISWTDTGTVNHSGTKTTGGSDAES